MTSPQRPGQPGDDASLTRQLVQHTRSKASSGDDLALAALFVLDAVANMLGGRNSDPGRLLLRWAGNGPLKPANPADTGAKALLMGGLTHILETDDLHRASVVHPGCVVVPAAWALALREGAGGQDFLRAVLEGFEVTTRVGMGVGPAHYRIWHNTATCGPYGSAMAAATLLGLDEDQSVHALGNAGSQSSGLWEFLDTGAMTKHLHAGHAAQAGVQSADLAALGFTGPPRILEGDKGFFAAACPDADPGRVMSGADGPWQLALTSMKPWPSCRHTHPAIDAALELSETLTHVSPDELHSVTVETYRAAEDVCDRPHAASDYEAKFSLQHCVATALENGEVTLASFSDEARVKAQRLASGIVIKVIDPYAAAYPVDWGSAVEVTLTDGSVHRAERTHAKGDPEAPLLPPDVVRKSVDLMEYGGVASPQRLAEAILALPMSDSLPELPLFG
jgi:2-methylcitrate dehydratase PrpD